MVFIRHAMEIKGGMLCGDVCRTGFFRDKCTHNGAPFLIFFQLFIAESRKKYQKKIKTAAFFETRRLPEQAGGEKSICVRIALHYKIAGTSSATSLSG